MKFLQIARDAARGTKTPVLCVEDIPHRTGSASDEVLAQRCKPLFALGSAYEIVVCMHSGEMKWANHRVSDVMRMYREGPIRSVHALPRRVVDDLTLGYALVRFAW